MTFAVAAAFMVASSPGAAAAPLNVVATTSSMAMLIRTVGADHVRITTLAPPDRDAHHLLARPSMMLALRRADLLVAVGADLEVGWLPAALKNANNSSILPGREGYFEGAATIELIERGGAADRSRGDVHPAGNPHFYMDPNRMGEVARALAARLGALRPEAANVFASNADAFAKLAEAKVSEWQRRAAGAPGAVFFHRDANYLAELLGVPILGYVEPIPGIPPTASHLRDLVDRLKGRPGVIISTTFHPAQGPGFLARSLGWPSHRLQLEVDLDADGAAYLVHIEKWVAALTERGSGQSS